VSGNGAWGWCRKHYIRWWKYGDPAIVKPHNWAVGDQVTYRGLHARISRARGLASEFTCECGNPAEQWSYDYTDPSPKFSEQGSPFSLDVRRYQAMCRSCHGKRDWGHRS